MKGQEEEGINWKYSQNTKKNSGQGQGQGGLVCLFVDVSGVVGTGGKRRMLKGRKEEGRKGNWIQAKSRSGWCMVCIRSMSPWEMVDDDGEEEEEEREGGPFLSLFSVFEVGHYFFFLRAMGYKVEADDGVYLGRVKKRVARYTAVEFIVSPKTRSRCGVIVDELKKRKGMSVEERKGLNGEWL